MKIKELHPDIERYLLHDCYCPHERYILEGRKVKYIRTKDGRIGEFYQDQSFTITCSLGCIDKKDIINRADTIKELCDEFVISGNRPIVISQTTVMYGRMSNKTPVIYGAIWTNKGLIYVAKMNEKGELELL